MLVRRWTVKCPARGAAEDSRNLQMLNPPEAMKREGLA
jgi:hypothetical protein